MFIYERIQGNPQILLLHNKYNDSQYAIYGADPMITFQMRKIKPSIDI